MTKNLLIVVVLGACTQQQNTTSLSELRTTFGDTHLEVVARSEQVNIVLHVDGQSGDCPLLRDEVSATFDNTPMLVARGGYDLDATGCYPIAFSISTLPMDQIHTFEASASGSQFLVKDDSARWGVDTGVLFGNHFIDDPAHAQITWSDVTSISTATLDPPVRTTIEGNIIHYPAGTQVDYVSAWSHATPTLCAGPVACSADIQGDRALGPINP
jgi:hypothetical protein